jgi:3-oxoadipate enol-lactonase
VGDYDDQRILLAADYLAAGIPGARKVVIPGVAHYPNMERPADFNRLVLEFLEA